WWQRSWRPMTMLRALSAPGGRTEMKSPRLENREPDLAVDVVIESEAWRMLPQAADIVRRAIALAATCPHPALPRARGRELEALPGGGGRAGWARCRTAELSVLLCDDKAMSRLNGRWRGQEKPTNVLSFPAPPLQGAAPDGKTRLGDIAIAYETLAYE